jgi:glucose-6-phosphate 1-dehydrogenase
MENTVRPDPTIFVIFGAGGDLTWRKLIPALYNLHLDGWMPERIIVLGLDRVEMTDDQFRNHLQEGVDKNSRRGKVDKKLWHAFAESLFYIEADFEDDKCFKNLAKRLVKIEKDWGTKANKIFYLAVPPGMVENLARKLDHAKLHQDRQRSRIVVEKPFGRDQESAGKLNKTLTGIFLESQIYRIDHYLGKETVQNILAFRFGNTLFEPLWNRHYIDHIQITVAESVGVAHRGGYYDQAGALRHMIQNHLLQILCLIAMEAPVSFNGNEVRNKKWEKIKPYSFPNYPAGTWGPEEAEILIARDGRSWVMPTYLQCQENLAAACHIMSGTTALEKENRKSRHGGG